jgi:hypothetical protein
MVKCPNCGSSAQVEEFDTLYHEDGEVIIVERRYHCGCNHYFHTLQTYKAIDIEEEDE